MLEMEPAVGSEKPADTANKEREDGKTKKAGFHQKDPPWCDWFWRLGFNTAGWLRLISTNKSLVCQPFAQRKPAM
ncbi:MAG: hypothetical protein ABIR76_03150 [Polaromonas sp.]